MTYDLLIKNARVVDGSGEPSFRADVAVHQGKIVGVGKYNAAARRTIDADGRGALGQERRTHALKTPNPARQLVVVSVIVPTAHRLAIATVLLGVFIHKESARQVAVCLTVFAPLGKPARDPFVPAGDKNKLGVQLLRSAPLFLEV